MAQQRSFSETMKYAWAEGLARHVVVTKEDKTVLNLPLTVVLLIAVFVSPLVAIGVVVALIFGYRIEMQRQDSSESEIILDEPPLWGHGSTPAPPEEDLPLAEDVHGDDLDPPGTASPEPEAEFDLAPPVEDAQSGKEPQG